MLKITNARMYNYPGTETDLIVHGSMGDIMDLTEDISENQNEIEFDGTSYYVTKMEVRQSKDDRLTGTLGLVVTPLDNLYSIG